MIARLAVLAVLAVLGMSSLSAAGARAEALPYATSARIGRPARAVPVRVAAQSEGVRITAGPSSAILPIAEPRSASVESVTLAGGGAVAIVRVEGATERYAALLAGRARPEIAWTGRLDPSGDPGERRRDVIEAVDRTGDGHPDVIVGVLYDATQICGQHETLLAPRAVDPRSLELREVAIRRLPEGVDEIPVTATAGSPGPTGAPLLAALHFRTASSSAGSADQPGMIPAPVALSDDSPETAWREGRAGPGRWEFATASYTGGDQRIRALAITMPPSDAASPPRTLYVVGDRGPRLRVTLPEPLARTAGARLWVTPPSPMSVTCLSVVLDEAWGAGPTAIAQIQAYTDLDFGEGIASLVEELVVDAERGAEAARLLATLGEPAVAAVTEAWETLTPTGRRRSIRVLADNARSIERARDGLVVAARDVDADVRADALRAIADLGDQAVPALTALVADPRAGDEAAVMLARRHPDAAIPVVLSALAEPGASERPALRRALRTAAQRGSDDARAAIREWVAAEPAMPAAAAAALALSRAPEVRESTLALLARASSAERFEDRWRLVLAAKALGGGATEWLGATARDADEWMLRAAAIDALAASDPDHGREVARAALDDPYPRVRVAALGLLAEAPGAVEPIATAARRDSWPMVRAAAVAALADDRSALPVVRAAVDDPSHRVRAAAVRALTQARDRASLAKIAARLDDPEEFPEVWEEAITYATTVCARELVEPVIGVLRRGMRPDAWAPDVDVAVSAVRALAILGGEEADEALERAARETAPPAIRAAAQQARRSAENCH